MELKLLLKRGALLAAANWPTIAIQLAARTTFQVLLAVPLIGAAILVAVLLGADLAMLLRGGIRDMFTAIADALWAEPVALVAFVAAFAVVLFGGSMFMFLIKGGTVDVLLTADAAATAIEREPITWNTLRSASSFTVEAFMGGCGRLFRRYLVLGLGLMAIYGASAAAYVAFLIVGYRAAGDRVLIIGWTLVAAIAAVGLVVWITLINLGYLLLQIAIAAEATTVIAAGRAVYRFVRTDYRELGGVFLVILVIVVAATFVSALAWSGVGLIAFVPLVGLAVFPLQIAALLVRGLVFEYIGLAALGAYVTLYHRYTARLAGAANPSRMTRPGVGSWHLRPN